MEIMKNYINGKWEEPKCSGFEDITNPSNGKIIGRTPLSLNEEVDKAIDAADTAFDKWRKIPVATRCGYLFKLQNLITENFDELTRTICIEEGKNLADAEAELKRAQQNVEVACGMPIMMQGDKLEGVAPEIDAEVVRQPLGVCGMIAPFNFPVMVPFWFLPYAVATGNTFVIKASKQVPMTLQIMFRLIDDIGFPPGVINLVNGDSAVADALLANPKVKAVSFVGSSNVARKIALECVKTNKRFQALGAAKNYLLVMEDAKMDKVVDSLLTSCYGCAGERCMAASVIAAVPQIYEELKVKFIEGARKLKVGDALIPDTDMGPVISLKARKNILNYIETGIKEGANLILDGRNIEMPGELKDGYFIGPTIFSEVTPDMTIVKEEIFGPVVCLMKINSLDEGLEYIRKSEYGNGASVFTQNGYYARKFEMESDAGMIGINIGIPAPVAYFPFGGMKESMYGCVKTQGKDIVEFYTQRKVITLRFFRED